MFNYNFLFFKDVGEVIIKSEPQNSPVKVRIKKENIKGTHHEALQRIYGQSDVSNYYQHHWFSSSLEVRLCNHTYILYIVYCTPVVFSEEFGNVTEIQVRRPISRRTH